MTDDKAPLELASIGTLLAELLHEGEAKNIPKLSELEPIPISDIVRILRNRTREDFGNNAFLWIDWFMQNRKFDTEAERKELRKLMEQVDRKAEYHVERLRERKSKGQ